ncbi:unnamed protein product [Lymnaea stagnalis]|uniref:Uncharacterized protein n=1 Tax=Lymnaea stagnalis TaxID=6523 RepID=A0AAV2I0T7_LYMST
MAGVKRAFRYCLVAFLSAVTLSKRGSSSTPRAGLSYEDTIINKVLESYKMRTIYSRPVLNVTDSMTVQFAVQLTQIMGLNEQDQVLTLNIWDQIRWRDDQISWDRRANGDVKDVRIPCENIWTPDIKLHNYADLRLKEHRDALCIISHDGEVYHVPQVVYRSSCLIDVYVFPFDVQNCTLKFGSWTYNYDQLDLQFYENKSWIDLTEYIESSSWSVNNVPAYRHVKQYTSTSNWSRVELQYHLIFQRRSALYNYILILPCILLTTITLVLFFIPPESPAKMQLGLAIFIAFFVLLRLLEKNLPPGASQMPLLGTYYCLNMILITLSSFLNVLIVDLTTHGQRTTTPPKIRKFFFNYLARCLRMNDLVKPFVTVTPKSRTPKEDLGKIEEKTWTHEVDRSNEALFALQRDPTQCAGPMAEIEHKLGELREFMRQQKVRLDERDKKESIAKQWKAVALILDRIFFFVYLIIIFASLSYTLPVLTWSNTNYNTSLVRIARGI